MPTLTKLAWQIPLMPGATQRVSVGKNRTGNCWIKSGLRDQISVWIPDLMLIHCVTYYITEPLLDAVFSSSKWEK